jgi:hypothetical protein
MNAGRRRAAARGEFIGWRPDGYVLEIELRDGQVRKRMVLDPDRQETIETIFRMALRGRPTGAIARHLNDRGWLTNPRRKDATPKYWNDNHIDAVLRNRRYAGLAVFGGEVVGRGHWPAYITETEHEKLKRRMARHVKNTRDKKPRCPESYLLAGLLRCGCGQPLYCTAGNRRKNGTRARRYVCASHDKDRHAARCTARRHRSGRLCGHCLGRHHPQWRSDGSPNLGLALKAHRLAHHIANGRPPHDGQVLEEPLLIRREANCDRLCTRRGHQMAISPSSSRRCTGSVARTPPASSCKTPSRRLRDGLPRCGGQNATAAQSGVLYAATA